MKLSHLRGRKTCDYVRKKGRVWRGKTMIIRWLPEVPIPIPPPNPRPNGLAGRPNGIVRAGNPPARIFLGTYAPHELHASAVKRNRMRRRCREALRVFLREYTADFPSVQMLMCPRHASLDAPFTEILADIRQFLSFLTH